MGKTNKPCTIIIPEDDFKLPEPLIIPKSTGIELKQIEEELFIEPEEDMTAIDFILAAIYKIEEQPDSTNKHKNISLLKEVLERLN